MEFRNEPTRADQPFISAPEVSLAAELTDRVVAIRPHRSEILETTQGSCEATFASILVVDKDGSSTDLGERPIFWRLVRRQLTAANEDQPWVAGRMGMAGKAYKLFPPDPAEEAAVGKALASLSG